jgi:hypothetical protein
MAVYDLRRQLDYLADLLTGAVTTGATAMSSPAFASLPVVTAGSDYYVPVVLGEEGQLAYEVVWVTAHAAGAVNVTVVRAREGTAAVAWAAGTPWRIAPTVRDFRPLLTRATLPTDAHLGFEAVLTDENMRIVRKVTAGWEAMTERPFGHVGCTDGFQSISAANGAYVVFSAVQDLVGGMTFDNATDALVIPITGRYRVLAKPYFTGGSNFNGTATVSLNSTALPVPAANGIGLYQSLYKWDAADYIGFGDVTRKFTAGDKLRLWMKCPNSTYGTDGYNGSFLEVEYKGAA